MCLAWESSVFERKSVFSATKTSRKAPQERRERRFLLRNTVFQANHVLRRNDYYPVTVDFVDLVIARKPALSHVPSSVEGAVEWVAICYPSKVEAVAVPKHLTMAPTVSIVTGYYPQIQSWQTTEHDSAMFARWRIVEGEGHCVWRIHGVGAFEIVGDGQLAPMVCRPVFVWTWRLWRAGKSCTL